MEPNSASAPQTINQTAMAPAAEETVPPSWPGAFGLYKYSKRAVKVNLDTLVLLWILNIVLSIVFNLLLKRPGTIVGYLVDSYIGVAIIKTFIASVRGHKVELGQALSNSAELWLKMIGLSILVALTLIISLLLLIVPFFIVLPRTILMSYYLVDQNLSIMDAYKAGWHGSEGHRGHLYGVIGATIAMALLSVTIIGIPFSIYFILMYSAAVAVVYEMTSRQPKIAAASPDVGKSPA